jgi:hypothetical protein
MAIIVAHTAPKCPAMAGGTGPARPADLSKTTTKTF